MATLQLSHSGLVRMGLLVLSITVFSSAQADPPEPLEPSSPVYLPPQPSSQYPNHQLDRTGFSSIALPGMRPVFETRYQDVTRAVPVTTVENETGETKTTYRMETTRVPMQTQRWVPIGPTISGRHPLVNALRSMSKDDEKREEKITELRQQLEQEFDQMHSRQEKEIRETRERLESLTKRHEQRGENRDKIVLRRMNELLGESDELDWDPNSIPMQTRNNGLTFNASANEFISPPYPNQIQPPTLPVGPAVLSPQPNSPTPYLRERIPLSDQTRPQAESDFRDRRSGFFNQDRTNIQAPALGKSNSANETIFSLARDYASAKAELEEAEPYCKATEELRAQGAVPLFELQKAQSRLKRAQQDMVIRNMQVDAESEALRRTIDFHGLEVKNARDKLSLIQTSGDPGIKSRIERLDAVAQLEKAEKARETAVANFEQFDKVMKTVEAPVEQNDNEKATEAE
ncbi:hypothetical protein CA13_39660 [Planctomycetes bacterium CA13]|uniref:Outer membrane efflux protein n=1 Tax=Novipirellula herctigrandis TaxID=2527986 RepID=A0A5C5Z7M4_9BACT|nr:hypothetical protein CA13_39660 [Planctomycetes bacterium CA13]